MNSTSVLGHSIIEEICCFEVKLLFESDSLRALHVGAFREGTVETLLGSLVSPLFTEVPSVPINSFFNSYFFKFFIYFFFLALGFFFSVYC